MFHLPSSNLPVQLSKSDPPLPVDTWTVGHLDSQSQSEKDTPSEKGTHKGMHRQRHRQRDAVGVVFPRSVPRSRGGGYLLFHFRSIIGVARFNFSVRNGKRWSPCAMATLVSFLSGTSQGYRPCSRRTTADIIGSCSQDAILHYRQSAGRMSLESHL